MLYESQYYGIVDTSETELCHFGVKGMRWGVRRYQKYDGSYTQAGVKRFKEKDADYVKSVNKYKAKKQQYKEGKATKQQVKYAKGDIVRTKNALKLSYKRLKKDKLADQGKKMYKEGKRIRSNNRLHKNIGTATGIAGYVTWLMYRNGNISAKNAARIGAAMGVANTVNAAVYMKNRYQNKRISAYYSH